MKRFLIFDYDYYYPAGGWNDYQGDFDTENEAKAQKLSADFRQIVDTETMNIKDMLDESNP